MVKKKRILNLLVEGLLKISIVITILIIIWISLWAGITILRRPSVSKSPSSEARHLSNSVPRFSIEEFTITAYCPCGICCGEWADGITASGHVIQKGDKFIAAPKEFDFGMMIPIPHYGTVPVLDRGGSIKGNHFDVYFDTHEEALEWGVVVAKYKVWYND